MSLVDERDRAVSPVIATILMVAIVVILAAVAGAYVLNVGSTADPAPAVRLDAVYDDRTSANGEYLNVTVQGGERAQTERLWFAVDGATDDSGNDATLTTEPLDQAGSELLTADTISIDATDFDTASNPDPVDLGDATVTLVWDAEPNDGEPGQTQTVWTWEAD